MLASVDCDMFDCQVRYIGMSSCFAYQLANMQACAEKHGWTKFISM